MSGLLPRSRVRQPTHRLIATRYPTVGVFDDLTADPDDLRFAFLLEGLTNDRMALAARRLALLQDDDIVTGPGATLVMAAFLHADPAGGRFTTVELGAWYASLDVDTAIAETLYHCDRRLRLSEGGFPASVQMRELVAAVDADLVDVRGGASVPPEIYDQHDYSAGQTFGAALRWPELDTGEIGIVYNSVRHPGGTNVCVFRPSQLRLPVLQADHYEYRWNGAGQVSVFRLTRVAINPPHNSPSPLPLPPGGTQSVPEKKSQ